MHLVKERLDNILHLKSFCLILHGVVSLCDFLWEVFHVPLNELVRKSMVSRLLHLYIVKFLCKTSHYIQSLYIEVPFLLC